jgi:hypothetical protein
LAGSTLLVLTFREALRGWSSALPPAERRMRAAFMLLFATVALTTTLIGALGQAWPALAEVRGGVIAVCAVTSAALPRSTHETMSISATFVRRPCEPPARRAPAGSGPGS